MGAAFDSIRQIAVNRCESEHSSSTAREIGRARCVWPGQWPMAGTAILRPPFGCLRTAKFRSFAPNRVDAG